MGGAERAFFQVLQGLQGIGVDVEGGIRKGSELVAHAPPDLIMHQLGFRSVWDILSKREITRLILSSRPDIVQTYMGRATRLTRMGSGARPLHIALLCGNYAARSFLHADAWITCTHWVADYLVRCGVPVERIHLIPNFITRPRPVSAQEVVELRVRWSIPESALIIAAIGRLVPVKGIDVLLNAFCRLPRALGERELVLVIAGDGPQRGALERQARGLGIAGRVRFVGWQMDPEPVYALADLIAFTSHAQEGFGLVVIEAWASLTPLVTTRALGPAEITRDGDNALQVDCGDDAALAAAIRRGLTEPDLAAQLRDSGWRTFQSRYSQEAVIGSYKTLYEQLLGH